MLLALTHRRLAGRLLAVFDCVQLGGLQVHLQVY
jgi:hypothetical protein